MRVLFVLASRGAGGAEILVRDLAVELRGKGIEVGIAFISRAADLGGSDEFEARYQEVLEAGSIVTFDMGHECRRNPLIGARRLRELLEQFQPDILHIHLQYGLLFRMLLRRVRIPTIYTHHIDRFRRGSTVFRLLSRPVDHFVAISRQTERLLRATIGNRVTRIMNAVRFTTAPRKPSKRDAAVLRILSAGGLYPQKDYPTLIGTAARLLADRPDLAGKVEFQIAGGGPERARLERLIVEAGVRSTVELLGIRTDVHQLMAESDMLLMTSAYEGLPIVLIEAASAGLPIVATDVGGCSEVVEHGKNGFLAQPSDVAALAGYVRELIDDPGLRRRLGEASLAIAQQFSITASAEQHMALYRSVIACNRGSSMSGGTPVLPDCSSKGRGGE